MDDVQTPDSLSPGDIVGLWRVERPAGRGTYGAVYRARMAGHPLSEPVALKLAIFPDDPRFVREVELLSRIQHPAVPALMDRGWWRPEGGPVHPYVVMKWAEGLTLYDWAEHHTPSSLQVLRVLAQVAEALEATHEKHCLHRDVKGDNIRVSPEGRAFLMDFGSGTWAGAAAMTDGPMPPNTRDYRSPQALRFHWSSLRVRGAHYEATPADDVYALGVAMYRVVTGEHPPPGTDPEAREDPVRPMPPERQLPRALNERVTPELEALIEWMLAEEVEDRPSAREVARAAEAAMKRAGPEAEVPLTGTLPKAAEVTPVPAPVSTGSQQHDSRWGGVLVAALLVLSLGMAVGGVQQHHAPYPSEEEPTVAQGEVPDAGLAKDGGTSDLGDTALTSREPFHEVPFSPEGISLQLPEQPLPGQKRAPCRRSGEVEINGGCWALWAGFTPPCTEETYEWKGACYYPIRERARPPTTKKPQ